jgi:hypothetical protein
MNKQPPKKWLDRYDVLDEDHHNDLEARAAVHEFRGKMPREEAESRAHSDYLRERAYDAAAHHLVGVRAAHAAGHMQAAQQHGMAYQAAMEAAGEDAHKPPPPPVLDRLKDTKLKVYTFKNHPADQFFPAQQEAASDEDHALSSKVEKLRALSAQLKASGD